MLPGFTALEKQCYVPSSIEKSRVRFIVTLLCCGEASEKVLCCQHPVPIPTWPLMIRPKSVLRNYRFTQVQNFRIRVVND